MRQLIRHRQGVIHAITPNNGNRRFLKGAHFARITTPGTTVGANYSVVNTSSTIPTAGKIHIPPSGLTLRVHSVDADGHDHNQHIGSMQAGDKIIINGIPSTLVTAPIWNTGVYAMQVQALPVVADGTYLCSIEFA